MAIWKLIGVALVGAILVVYLKNTKSDLAIVASVAVGTVLLAMTLSEIGSVVESFQSIVNMSSIDSTMCGIIVKITGISYLIEFASDTIEDFGCKSIADKVLFGGKILILTLSLPIVTRLITLLSTVISGGVS